MTTTADKNNCFGEPIPKDSSTVILMRDTDQDKIEIFFMQRHKNQAFMGGMYVFPGGKLDQEDCNPDLAACATGLTVDDAKMMMNEPELSDEIAIGLFFTAIRETFEEAGALLAVKSSGEPIDLNNPEINRRFNKYRKKIHKGEMSLKELAEIEDIKFSLDLLKPYVNLITPVQAPKRFNTRFLLAQIPKGQAPIHDSVEMTDSLWTTAKGALERHNAGEIMLSPPTLKVVEDISRFSSVEQLIASVEPENINCLLLQHYQKDDQVMLLLPHDPEYSIQEFKMPHCPDETSRIAMIDGIWKTMHAE